MGNLTEVAKKSQIEDGNMKNVEIGDNTILIANIKGSYYAVEGNCTHMGARLSNGMLDGTTLQCPKHQLSFDITTGKILKAGKCGAGASTCAPLKVYPVKIEGDSIKIEI